MVTVDSDGRVALPKDVRDRIGITSGTEVSIYEVNGKAIVEPASPETILERMNQLVADAGADRRETADGNPIAYSHRDAVRRGAAEHSDERR